MPLTPCPECGHQISFDAPTCPECGFPVRNTVAETEGKHRTTPRSHAESTTTRNVTTALPETPTAQTAQPCSESEPKGVANSLGRAIRHIRRGEWRESAKALNLKAWFGRYVGFVLVVGIYLVVLVSTVTSRTDGERPTPRSNVWDSLGVLTFCAFAGIPIGILIVRSLVRKFGFRLRSRSLIGGTVEGMGLAVIFVAFMVLMPSIETRNTPSTSPVTSSVQTSTLNNGQKDTVNPSSSTYTGGTYLGDQLRQLKLPRLSDKSQSFAKNSTSNPEVENADGAPTQDTIDESNDLLTGKSPKVVLSRFLGTWDVKKRDGNGSYTVARAVSVTVPGETWVLWRAYDLDGRLNVITLAGYDPLRREYVRYVTGRGLASRRLTGEWRDAESAFTWKLQQPGGISEAIHESVNGDVIKNHITRSQNSAVTEEEFVELERTASQRTAQNDSELLDLYLGTWDFSSTFVVAGMKPIENHGQRIAVRLHGEPVIVERAFNKSGGLATIELLTALDGGNQLRSRAFNNAGLPYDMEGRWDANKSTMTWTAKLPMDESVTRVDAFTSREQYTSTISYTDVDGHETARGIIDYRYATTALPPTR